MIPIALDDVTEVLTNLPRARKQPKCTLGIGREIRGHVALRNQVPVEQGECIDEVFKEDVDL